MPEYMAVFPVVSNIDIFQGIRSNLEFPFHDNTNIYYIDIFYKIQAAQPYKKHL